MTTIPQGAWDFWPVWPMLGAGIGVVAHAVPVRLATREATRR
jgi:hypothetical protein